MKRITAILILFAYLIPAIGFTFEIHWCGKKITSFKLVETTHDRKCSCGIDMPVGCCKDFKTVIKLSDNQKASAPLSIPQNNFTQLPSLLTEKAEHLFSQNLIFNILNYHSPPINNKLPVYLNNCIFRI